MTCEFYKQCKAYHTLDPACNSTGDTCHIFIVKYKLLYQAANKCRQELEERHKESGLEQHTK